jgi:hypothetical protein
LLFSAVAGASAFAMSGVPIDRDALEPLRLSWKQPDALRLKVLQINRIGPEQTQDL